MHRTYAFDFTNISEALAVYAPLSEDRQNIRRTSHTTRHITDLTRHEETPAIFLLTLLCEGLQIEQLTNWASPSSQQNLMARPILLRRPSLC